ncbi:MAG: hypothetical protein AB4080_01890 [Trichodesmium sp.]
MSGVPIKAWDTLINTINQLKNDWVATAKKVDYKYTWASFGRTLEPKIPTQIIDLPEGNNYEIIVNNKSENPVFLYLGPDGKENLKIDNSALEIYPKYGKSFESLGCVLWAISGEKSDIIITVNSVKPKSIQEMVIALDIALKVGTGDLLGKDIPLTVFASIYSDWEYILTNIIDSDQVPKVTGYKLAYLRSFQPGVTYEFTVNVDPAFTDFENGVAKPLHVHLIDSNQIQTALIASVAAMRGVSSGYLEDAVKRMIGFAKSASWVANLPPTGGTFSITPGNAQSVLQFGAYIPGTRDTCIITDFDKTTNTFTLGGY